MAKLSGFWKQPDWFEFSRKNNNTFGKNCKICHDAFIDNEGRIDIGDDVTITMGCVLLTHDASTKNVGLETKTKNIKIGNNVFIGMRSIVMPGITIEDNVIIGAGSIVTKNIPSNEVWVGNPAHFLMTTKDYKKKYER